MRVKLGFGKLSRLRLLSGSEPELKGALNFVEPDQTLDED